MAVRARGDLAVTVSSFVEWGHFAIEARRQSLVRFKCERLHLKQQATSRLRSDLRAAASTAAAKARQVQGANR